MSTGNGPQAAVIDSGIFKRDPESCDVLRFSVKKRAVLMTGDFAANFRLLEDIHRLKQQWLFDPEIGNQLPYDRGTREFAEDRVKFMKRMPDLVNRTLFALFETAIWKESIFFKEESNLVSRLEEVSISKMILRGS